MSFAQRIQEAALKKSKHKSWIYLQAGDEAFGSVMLICIINDISFE